MQVLDMHINTSVHLLNTEGGEFKVKQGINQKYKWQYFSCQKCCFTTDARGRIQNSKKNLV